MLTAMKLSFFVGQNGFLMGEGGKEILEEEPMQRVFTVANGGRPY